MDSSQDIILGDASQHSSRMRCYFHHQHNCFIDYFDNSVLDVVVINAEGIPFWYYEQEGMYTDMLGSPTGNIFLAASRDHEFLQSHRGTVLHVPHTCIESSKPSNNYMKNSSSSSTVHMHVSSLYPNDSLHLMYNTRKRDAQVEYLGLIKTVLRNTIQKVNFADPIQTWRTHEALCMI